MADDVVENRSGAKIPIKKHPRVQYQSCSNAPDCTAKLNPEKGETRYCTNCSAPISSSLNHPEPLK